MNGSKYPLLLLYHMQSIIRFYLVYFQHISQLYSKLIYQIHPSNEITVIQRRILSNQVIKMECSNVYTMVCTELYGDTSRTLDPFLSDDRRVELKNFSTIRCPLNCITKKMIATPVELLQGFSI